jgi:hypothetical protein
MHPDERQLAKGIQFTDVPAYLKSMVDSLVWESTRLEEGCVRDVTFESASAHRLSARQVLVSNIFLNTVIFVINLIF